MGNWVIYSKVFFFLYGLQVGSLRVSWCPATWSISSCRSCLSSTAMSNSVHATPMRLEVWRWTKQHWTRLPRQCCMSPKRRDSSQPRDASPYHSGSISFSRSGRNVWPEGGVRSLYQPICIQSSRGDVTSRLCAPAFPLTQTRRYNSRVSQPLKRLSGSRADLVQLRIMQIWTGAAWEFKKTLLVVWFMFLLLLLLLLFIFERLDTVFDAVYAVNCCF